MAKFFLDTNPKPGDSDAVLLAKLLQRIGGSSSCCGGGDSDYILLQKILVQWGGVFSPGDSEHTLLSKILEVRGGTVSFADTIYNLLWKLLEQEGGEPKFGDTINNLLVKLLRQFDPVVLSGLVEVALADFVARAGITDATQIAATSALITAAMAHGWWDKSDLIYPFVGGSANAHAQNLKSSGFTVAWSGTVAHNANGITGNAVDGYGNTGYRPASSGQITQNSVHFSTYRRTFGTVFSVYLGVGLAPGILLEQTNVPTSNYILVNDGTLDVFTSSQIGMLAGSRIDSTTKRGFQVNQTAKLVNSTGVPTSELFILALNNGGPTAFSDANLVFTTVGSGLTFAEYQQMEADVQAFQTALGREITPAEAALHSFVSRSGLVDAGQIAATGNLIAAAMEHGWWDLCDLIYPFVGGTASAHRANLKSANFPVTWNGAVTHNANGITGDGATGYGNPGYIPSSSGQMALNSVHTTVYTRVNGNAGGVYFGGTDGANNILYLACGQGNTANEMAMAANCPVGDIAFLAINRVNGTLNFTAMDRYDAVNVHGYSSEAAGVYGPMDQSTAQASTGVQSTVAFILAYNNNGGAVLHNTANVAFLTSGASIGFVMFQLMYADIEAFQTALGRQV